MNSKSVPATVFQSVDDSIALGRTLAKARKACKLTQQELCNLTGIAYSTLTKIERGAIKKPNVFTVFQIARATNLKIDDLMKAQLPKSPPAWPPKTSSPPVDLPAAKGVKFVYFDVHQVLINSSNSMLHVLASRLHVQPSQIEDLFIRYNHRLCRGQLDLKEFNQIVSQACGGGVFDWQEYYLESAQADAEMKAVQQWLKKRLPLGLLTNAFAGNIQALIDHKIIADDYAVIVDSSRIGLLKPEKKIYEYAQAQAGVEPHEILLIDDRYMNILAAQNCGWQGLWLNRRIKGQVLELVQKKLDL